LKGAGDDVCFYKTMNNNYNKSLKTFARENRKSSTKAEIRIWCELLKNKKMLGFQFLRQRPIDNYIADFLCKELNLIIEIDGYSHQFKFEEDINRDKKLNSLGFQTLRFTDDEVKNYITNVERAIIQWIEENKK
jgi:very-short-patch-repair endonuclease